MTAITATASSDNHAAWARLQTSRRQLAADLIPVQADAQTITSDRAAVAAAEAEVARIEGVRTVTAGKVAAVAVQAESAAVAEAQTAQAKKELPFGRALDVTV
ncbi:hypothetical protein [Actinoplanes siamensis]|uniref:Uncharacterized protein n=1 Tax=Actinoplanes siamensis TaxID=1223317 RepID=A0A919TMC4_9ACTN|nr:hypothetical protein [Actinoplanes siamensis]GIF07404.1 hypothetical protein Asi03nite_49420 [Actinoplanes siamensis]